MQRPYSPKGINTVRKRLANGSITIYRYHRASGARLAGEPGSATLARSVATAEKAMIAHAAEGKHPGTVSSLIFRFCKSAEWFAFAESTRRIAALNLKAVESKWGRIPIAELEAKGFRTRVLEWRDEIAEKHKRAADGKIAIFARTLSWALDRELISRHPLYRVRKLWHTNRADVIWTETQIAAFRTVASPEIALALDVALETGQRKGDLLCLTWGQFDGKGFTLEPSKSRRGDIPGTGRKVYVPLTEALFAKLRPHRSADTLATVLTRPDGGRWTVNAFNAAWKKALVASGINAPLHFHDLRGTAVTRMSEAGCKPQEIAAITGHALRGVEAILDRYLSRTRTLAENAIVKLDADRRK